MQISSADAAIRGAFYLTRRIQRTASLSQSERRSCGRKAALELCLHNRIEKTPLFQVDHPNFDQKGVKRVVLDVYRNDDKHFDRKSFKGLEASPALRVAVQILLYTPCEKPERRAGHGPPHEGGVTRRGQARRQTGSRDSYLASLRTPDPVKTANPNKCYA